MSAPKLVEVNTGHKDGNDNDMVPVSYHIKIVSNGYILTTEYEDGSEAVEVFHNIGEVYTAIDESLLT